ncbi:MAG: FAD-dependent oxidoreductase [Oscillospiraceae bacterium]|nr:FAD-dependent oxidoreductase [Oscillospiraceae bacterium]
MNTVTEEKREIRVAGEADVIVIGGGIAGCAAALAARRRGARVTLIEKSIILGGLATLGHVCIYLPIDEGKGRRVYGGLAQELLHLCIKYGYDNLPDCWRDGALRVENPTGRYRTNFNIPAAVFALDEIMKQEGVDVVFDTVFSEPIMQDGVCRGVIVENKSGRTAYMARAFVDASGDADLMFRAGAGCEEQRNIVSHWAHELDFKTMQKGIENGSMISAAPLRWIGQVPHGEDNDESIPEFYGTSSEEVNAYIRTSRELALDFLKKNLRDDYCMLTLPLMPQYRMTRRIIGIDELKVVPESREEHSIGCMIDSIKPTDIYEFPYEGLLSPKIKNVAAAGRIVSAGGRAWEIARFIPACALTGHAAGAAAAETAKTGKAMQDIDVPALQASLAADGVILHMEA